MLPYNFLYSITINNYLYCDMISGSGNSKSNRLTLYILLAMVAGVALGFVLNKNLAGQAAAAQAKVLEPFSLLADIFLRLIKMIVAPLVFTTLVVGVAKQGSVQTVGRIGGKTLLWFLGGSFLSLFLGMVLVNFFQPGAGIHVAVNGAAQSTTTATSLSLKEFISHIFPTSIFDAMARNEILQVVVFSLFFGVATASVGEKGHIVVKAMDAAAHIILKMTGYIMNFAPVAGLQIEGEFAFGADYAKTLCLWRDNFNQKLAEVRHLGFDETFIRLWNFYLMYCAAGFAERNIDVVQFTLSHHPINSSSNALRI